MEVNVLFPSTSDLQFELSVRMFRMLKHLTLEVDKNTDLNT